MLRLDDLRVSERACLCDRSGSPRPFACPMGAALWVPCPPLSAEIGDGSGNHPWRSAESSRWVLPSGGAVAGPRDSRDSEAGRRRLRDAMNSFLAAFANWDATSSDAFIGTARAITNAANGLVLTARGSELYSSARPTRHPLLHSAHAVDVARVVGVRGGAQSTRRKWLGDAVGLLPTKTALGLAGQ